MGRRAVPATVVVAIATSVDRWEARVPSARARRGRRDQPVCCRACPRRREKRAPFPADGRAAGPTCSSRSSRSRSRSTSRTPRRSLDLLQLGARRDPDRGADGPRDRGAGGALGPGIGGLLNVTFGNAPELIIALFALDDGPARGRQGLADRLGDRQRPARDGRVDVRRRPRARPPALQPRERGRAVLDAAAGGRRDGDAGDLRARRGQGPAAARRRARRLRLDRRAALARRRDRADRSPTAPG